MVIGLVTLFAILLVVLCALGGLVSETAGIALWDELNTAVTVSIIRFTLWQAMLSTLLSVALAVPLARALARRRHFLGRGLIMRLSSISLIIPSMVAVLGIVAVHGRNGWINQWLVMLGGDRHNYLYGLGGILLAHVFFNLPLASRIFLNGLLTIPQHTWNLAHLYGLKPRHIFWRIEWPLLRGLMGGVSGLVFLLCFTSFAIVLTLGGGPKSTTLEVAIYQAIRFDFNLAKAVALSLIQVGLCGVLALLFFARGTSFPLRAADAPGTWRSDSKASLPRCVDAVVLVVVSVFLITPLVALLLQTVTPRGWSIITTDAFWLSLRWTLVIALLAGLLSCLLALAISSVIVSLRRSPRFARWAVPAELIGVLTLLVPPITLGAGLFLFFRWFTDALSLGLMLVIVLNALLTLAFGIRIVVPVLLAAHNRYANLCANLGIRGWSQWQYVLWPALQRPLAYALAIATTLSAGDMGVIALFGTENLHTLPLLMYRLVGNYRLEQAAVTAVLLCALCFTLFWLIERIGRYGDDAPPKTSTPATH